MNHLFFFLNLLSVYCKSNLDVLYILRKRQHSLIKQALCECGEKNSILTGSDLYQNHTQERATFRHDCLKGEGVRHRNLMSL